MGLEEQILVEQVQYHKREERNPRKQRMETLRIKMTNLITNLNKRNTSFTKAELQKCLMIVTLMMMAKKVQNLTLMWSLNLKLGF